MHALLEKSTISTSQIMAKKYFYDPIGNSALNTEINQKSKTLREKFTMVKISTLFKAGRKVYI